MRVIKDNGKEFNTDQLQVSINWRANLFKYDLQVMGGGVALLNTCIFKSSFRRLALARLHIFVSLLVFALPLLFLQPTVFAQTPNLVKELRTSTPTNSSTVTEAGSTLTFTVRLGQAPSANVTVAVSSNDESEGSVSPSELTFTAQNYNIAQTVTVTGVDDNIIDGSQNWNVVLNPSSSGDSGYDGLSNVNVEVTTTDDDPKFLINSPSVTEGDSGEVDLVFTVTLSASSTSPLTLDYTDAGTGTANSGTDYTAVPAGRLTFAAGETRKTVTVKVKGDTLSEGNETVVLILISGASGTGTIIDNDLRFSVDSPSVVEGDSSEADLVFTVTLSASSTTQQTVDYADAGTGTATSGMDYTAVTAGMLTFAAGETSKTVTVKVKGDTLDEGAGETVVVKLSNATTGISTGGGTAATVSTSGTITDDDPNFSINSPSVTEGDNESENLVFTVRLSRVSTTQYTVDYADTSSGTATSGTDYTAVTAGTLTFAAGVTTQTITIQVKGDVVDEGNETVVIELSNATTGTGIGGARGTGTIVDNDPKFSIDDASVTEGDSGTANLVFTVWLSGAGATQYTVNYADTGSGTATSGTDYTAVTAGTLTFAAGVRSQTITVPVRGDTMKEEDETVVIELSSAPSGTTISKGEGTGKILDDDTPRFSYRLV